MKQKLIRFFYYVIPCLCLFPFMSAPIALGCGIVLAFLRKDYQPFKTSGFTKHLLQGSIVLMGFGMQLETVLKTAGEGILITAASVFVTLIVGVLLGRWLKVNPKIATLVAGGTAICGGSAIAAISPVINARNNHISFALGVIFILNAIALFIFPPIGHALGLSEETFGRWAAIAIHDTSSVVGAGSIYGPTALEIATTIKLTRTLWIVPLALMILVFNQAGRRTGPSKRKISIPWFIAFFIVAVIIPWLLGLVGVTGEAWTTTFSNLNWMGKKGMLLALFFIGTSLSPKSIRSVGIRPLLQGILLWIFMGVGSLIVFLFL